MKFRERTWTRGGKRPNATDVLLGYRYIVPATDLDDEGHACFAFNDGWQTWSVATGPAVQVIVGYTNRKAKRQRCKLRRRARLSA